MKPAPLPPDEAARLAALRHYEILDTVPEQAFDDLTLIAAQICQVSMAQVSFIDRDRQWFKSRLGIEAQETSRDIAFCAHTILHHDEVMEVRDATQDPRFADSPLVTAGEQIRFYAGAPLISPDGHALGALCVMDRRARSLSPEQAAALQALSRRVVAQLELRLQARQLAASQDEMRRLLADGEKSRRALLSVLEDEKLATRNLRESEERFRAMAENIEEVFWMRDVEQNGIIYISPGYELIWGRPCAELYASVNFWVESIHEGDRDRVLHAATTKQATGDYDETYRIVRPDRSIRWVRDRAFPVKEADGRLRRVVGVAEDVTERKKLEEQFLHAQRMEAVGTLAGGIAHDLNNILAPVLMAAGLLRDRLPDPHDQAMLKMVETSAQRGADIIRQLLTFSRGIEGARVAVQLRHLIKDMVHIMRETFPRDITIDQEVPANLWSVTADPTQLHQVLMNLCVNARDAMANGGRLRIRAQNALRPAPGGNSDPAGQPEPVVTVSVTDTGTGIPPEAMDRIFDPFFTTKEVGKGTGLGLSTVMGIIKSHGGTITVASEVGKGTTFTMTLPAVRTAAPQNEITPRTVTGGQGELILVVDDEENVREAIQSALEAHNYRVLLAANGREAVQRFLEHQDGIQLVLTDVMMPLMGGLELTRSLRTINPRLSIVAMTGQNQETRQAEFEALGVSEILLKPFLPDTLLFAIGQYLGRT
ncbi:MAG TPA: ATP-binding protein [Lacunisphaera sp.]|nr:ATP-binding protein [Lacunisphaera sp.]